jgi:hypothetical protein
MKDFEGNSELILTGGEGTSQIQKLSEKIRRK